MNVWQILVVSTNEVVTDYIVNMVVRFVLQFTTKIKYFSMEHIKNKSNVSTSDGDLTSFIIIIIRMNSALKSSLTFNITTDFLY